MRPIRQKAFEEWRAQAGATRKRIREKRDEPGKE